MERSGISQNNYLIARTMGEPSENIKVLYVWGTQMESQNYSFFKDHRDILERQG